MAQNIRVNKDMRLIIDFYRRYLENNGLTVSVSDAAIVETIMRLWLYQNYTAREADEILQCNF